jgi:hypothetical protein
MHFIFGYQREIPVEIEKNTSKTGLVFLGILVVLLFIFLSFENLAKDTSIPPSIFEKSPSLDKPSEPAEVEEIEFEKYRTFPEENSKLLLVSDQGGLK